MYTLKKKKERNHKTFIQRCVEVTPRAMVHPQGSLRGGNRERKRHGVTCTITHLYVFPQHIKQASKSSIFPP